MKLKEIPGSSVGRQAWFIRLKTTYNWDKAVSNSRGGEDGRIGCNNQVVLEERGLQFLDSQTPGLAAGQLTVRGSRRTTSLRIAALPGVVQ